MSFRQLWIQFQGLANIFKRFAVKPIGTDERKSIIGLRVLWIFLERLLKEICGVGIVKAFVHQLAPADAIESVRGRLPHREAKLIVRFLIHLYAPITFCFEVGIVRGTERDVAFPSFVKMSMLAECVAVVRRRGPG